ncbi:MAG TPA: PEP-CTERM sorting domain-containing protein, partial [Pirellulales bacterium]|nr:PEP-CTERM sorting domain-containing protein [Pirellulales bacterium]
KTGMTWSQGDYNYDGTVDISDLGSVLANYNKSLPDPGISGMSSGGLDAQAIQMLTAAGFSVGVVPEPSTLLLLATGLLGLVCYAWRKRK